MGLCFLFCFSMLWPQEEPAHTILPLVVDPQSFDLVKDEPIWLEVQWRLTPEGPVVATEPAEKVWWLGQTPVLFLGATGYPPPAAVLGRGEAWVTLVHPAGQTQTYPIRPARDGLALGERGRGLTKQLQAKLGVPAGDYLDTLVNFLTSNLGSLDVSATAYVVDGYGVVINENGEWVGDPTGLAGPVGDMGPQGEQGPVGPVGAAGPQGPQGIVGSAGADGPQGAQGPQGPQGPQGAMGAVGLVGADGDPGPVGNQGPPGEQGAVGPKGVDGPQGAPGPQGPAGPAGPQGDQGGQGPMGPMGLTGGAAFAVAAGQSVAVGDVVTLVGNTVRTGLDAAGDRIFYSNFEILSEMNGVIDWDDLTIAPLSDDRYLLLYEDQANADGRAMIVNTSDTGFTVGPPVSFADDSGTFSVTVLNAQKILITARHDNDGGRGYARIGNIKGDTITFGADTLFYSGNINQTLPLVALDANTALVFPENQRYVVLTLSGDTVTPGNLENFGPGATRRPSMVGLGNGRFAIFYVSGGMPNLAVGELNGSSLNLGTPVNQGGTSFARLVSRDANSFLFSSNGEVYLAEVSGLDVSLGPVNNLGVDVSPNLTRFVDQTHFVAITRSVNTWTTWLGEITGNAVAFNSANVFTTEDIQHALLRSSSGRFYLLAEVLSQATVVRGNAGTGPLLGIAQSAGSNGETVYVQVSGVASGLSGLTAGLRYYATPDGSLTEVNTGLLMGQALSSSALLLLNDGDDTRQSVLD